MVEWDDETYFGVNDDKNENVTLNRRDVLCYEVDVQLGILKNAGLPKTEVTK